MPVQISPFRLAAVLPRGGRLDDLRWERHHRVLRWLLACHLPVLALLASRAQWPAPGTGVPLPQLALLAVPTLLLVLGWRLRARWVRALAVSLGLALCSVLLVLLTGGAAPAYLQHLVVLGFVCLYHDWRPYLTAFGVLVASSVVIPGLPWTPLPVAGVTAPWAWAGVQAGLLVLAGASQVMLWKISEVEQDHARRYYAELYSSERALIGRLQEAERAKRELLALASHELRTPLTGIIGSARTLDRRLEDLDGSQVRTLLNHIDLHARRLTRLVDNLVASAGSVDVDAAATADVAVVVSTTVQASRGLPSAAGHDVRLRISGEAVAMIDERAARRVVSNLLDNAFKFAEPGSAVEVSVRREDDEVLLEVENEGPPVPDEVRQHLGEAFAQGDSSDARRAEGMGLGLHVICSLVRPYDGVLELCEPAGCVRFRVRLHARRCVPAGELSTVA